MLPPAIATHFPLVMYVTSSLVLARVTSVDYFLEYLVHLELLPYAHN